MGIYNDHNSLLESILKTINAIEKQMLVINTFDSSSASPIHSLSKEQATFLWHQLLLHVLQDTPSDPNEKGKCLQSCRTFYQNNDLEMLNIEKFRVQYRPDQAIEWYTRECFLYKILNKAFRDSNIELIYLFRFFIIDLWNDLLSEKEKITTNTILTLYRGTRISTLEMDKYNKSIGKLISTRSFFSTSLDKSSALHCAESTFSPFTNSSNYVGVIFVISADPSKNILLADITHRSQIEKENEVLFGPNAVFHVNEVEFDQTTGHYMVKMTATDEFENCFYKYLSLQQEEMTNYEPCIYFGRILFNQMEETEKAKAYFKILLKRLPTNDGNIPVIFCQIGDLSVLKKDYKSALCYYEKALNIYKNFNFPNHTGILDCLLRIGKTYLEEGKAEQGLLFSERAMKMINRTSGIEIERIAMIHQMIGKGHLILSKVLLDKGNVYAARVQTDKADKNLTTAYTIFEAIKELEQEHFVSILGDLSALEEIKENHKEARKLLRKQLDMLQHYLPFDDPKQRIYLRTFMDLYEMHGMRSIAMKEIWRKIEHYQACFGETHSSIAEILITVGYYDKACHILLSIEPIDEQKINLCLNKLTKEKFANKKKLSLFQKWLNYLILNYPTYERRIADTLRHLAGVYNDMGKFNDAFSYLYLSLQIYKYHQDHLNMRLIEDFMRDIEQCSGRVRNANILHYDDWQNELLLLGLRFNDTANISMISQQHTS